MGDVAGRASEITGETRISRTGDWLSADTGDGAVMMSPSATEYIGLSGTAGRIWELLETPRTLAELCAALASEYQVTPDEVSADVKEFVAGLAERGALALT
jgi:hypothetical protein